MDGQDTDKPGLAEASRTPGSTCPDPDSDQAVFRRILHNIDLAWDFSRGQHYDDFRADVMRVYAVAHCVEIVCDASHSLRADLKSRHPEIRWQEIEAAVDAYREDYEDVAASRVLEVVRRDFPHLKAAIEQELRAGPPGA